jgi:hypothetical protein
MGVARLLATVGATLFPAAAMLIVVLITAEIVAGPTATHHALAVISHGGPLWLAINTQCQGSQEQPMTIVEWCDERK